METLRLPPGNEAAFSVLIKQVGYTPAPRSKQRLVAILALRCITVVGDDNTNLTILYKAKLRCVSATS